MGPLFPPFLLCCYCQPLPLLPVVALTKMEEPWARTVAPNHCRDLYSTGSSPSGLDVEDSKIREPWGSEKVGSCQPWAAEP